MIDYLHKSVGKNFSEEYPFSNILVSMVRAKVPDREFIIEKVNLKNGTVLYHQIEGEKLPDHHKHRMDWGRFALEKSIEFNKNSENLEALAFSWYY